MFDRATDGQDVSPVGVGIAETEAAPMRALWCAVIEAQFHDAIGLRSKKVSNGMLSAQHWFSTGAFQSICALAGVEPEPIHRRVVELVALPHDERLAQFDREVGVDSRYKRTLPSLQKVAK